MTLGDIIREYRIKHDMSITDFAQKSGISRAYISMLENNRNPQGNTIKPSVETIDKVATAMKMEFDSLIRRIDGEVIINGKDSFDTNVNVHLDEDEQDIAELERSGLVSTNEFYNWALIQYCFEHAPMSEKRKVLNILKVQERLKQYEELTNILKKKDK